MGMILASGSPRRRELMEMLGFKDMRIIPARGEEIPPPGLGPAETVMALSAVKAREVSANMSPGDLLVAADTVVWLDGEMLGKPRDAGDARRMLRALSGREHEVYSGVTVMRDGAALTDSERTRVRFRELSEREIDAYVATGEPMDKAGAYAAQGLASLFVTGIDGDFFNVMGLPLCKLGLMLSKLNVELF